VGGKTKRKTCTENLLGVRKGGKRGQDGGGEGGGEGSFFGEGKKMTETPTDSREKRKREKEVAVCFKESIRT